MDLLEAARRARDNAYAPYSGFKVGAAIRCPDGSVFAGCNVENVAYPQGTCAEAGAIAAMVAAGRTEIAEVLVVADGPEIITPCGGCRQKLAEFARPDAPVILAGLDGERARTTVGALLPGAFTPGAPGGGAHERSATTAGAGARLPRPHQPRRRLRRGRDHRALPPRARPRTARSPRSASGRDFVAQARRRARQHRASASPPWSTSPAARSRWRTSAPRPARRSPTAPTRSTSWCPGGRSPRATPRRSPPRCARSRTSAAPRR